MLDRGVCTVSFASMVCGGAPTVIKSMAHLGETGVDEQAAMVLAYGEGEMALLHTAIRVTTGMSVVLEGTDGMITVHRPFWQATGATLSRPGHEPETFDQPLEGNGYHYQAAEVMRCVRAGKRESDVMPLDETISVMETLDAIRAQWGLKYPME